MTFYFPGFGDTRKEAIENAERNSKSHMYRREFYDKGYSIEIDESF
jgi:hypothetical protein